MLWSIPAGDKGKGKKGKGDAKGGKGAKGKKKKGEKSDSLPPIPVSLYVMPSLHIQIHTYLPT